ncbi:SH3 domain-containing protein [Halpernia frigidisoli]|uniref:SH3 domain-containing protein n=1 Tax=Halpernia frigidisoli TaxID=1125876 RepID=A0A1I3IPK5_9FLAO|nr:SH3 domain-containing protein [Halpernia frigidisoli]SFI49894.1 SH3 domain-containing protein [Halpernia frigidisoli]
MKIINLCITSIFFLFLSCNGQDKDKSKSVEQSKINKKMNSLKEAPYNISDEGDGTKSNYDNLSLEFINKAKKILEQRRFQFPNEENFNLGIQEVFGFQLSEYQNIIFALQPSMFPEVAIRKENFVFIQDPSANSPEYLNPDLLYHFNSYIFYNTPVSYLWLQTHEQDVLYNLVIHYGYNKDKKLVQTVFKKFDFNSLSNMEELIFKDDNSRKILKKDIFDDIENIIYKGPVEDFSYAKEGNGYLRIGDIIDKISLNPQEYVEPDQIKSYLFERELNVGIQGDIESYLNKNKNYKSILEKNNYYNLPKLKDYVDVIYQSPKDLEMENTTFTIQDPDGFTNLRKEKNSTSEILQKIKSGEHIDVLDNSGDWFLVKTKEGNQGYVHKSRIRFN